MFKKLVNSLKNHWKPCVAIGIPVLAAVIAAIMMISGDEGKTPSETAATTTGPSAIPITGTSGTLTPITLDISTAETPATTTPASSETDPSSETDATSATSEPTETTDGSETTDASSVTDLTEPPETTDVTSDSSETTEVTTEPPETTETTTTGPIIPAPLAWHSDTLSGAETDSGLTLLQYQIQYPVFEGDEAADKINETVAAAVAAYEKHAKEDLLVYAKQVIKTGPGSLPYRMSVDFDVKISSSTAVSVTFTKVEHTGDSRDSSERSAVKFDRESGSKMALGTVLTISTEDLYSMILKRISEKPEKYYADYENLVRFFDLTDRWYFNENGLVVFFNPYEIAPFDAGIVSFVFTYSELSGMLTLNPMYIG